MTANEVRLMRVSAAALRADGETASADDLDRAASRMERLGAAADLDGIRSGVFKLTETDLDEAFAAEAPHVAPPVPRPPRRKV